MSTFSSKFCKFLQVRAPSRFLQANTLHNALVCTVLKSQGLQTRVWLKAQERGSLFSVVFTLLSPCFHLAFTLLSPCFHLAFTLLSPCFHLCALVFTCVHLCSLVFTCVHLFSFVFTLFSLCFHFVFTLFSLCFHFVFT